LLAYLGIRRILVAAAHGKEEEDRRLKNRFLGAGNPWSIATQWNQTVTHRPS
jgi:hypothetical protein